MAGCRCRGGFSLVSAPASPVAPGGSTSFTLQLDAAAGGWYGGLVSLGNNDSDESPFDFYVYGEVMGWSAPNAAPTLDAIADLAAIPEDAGLQTVSLTGITAGGADVQNLTVTASSSNPPLISGLAVSYVSPGATGAITFTPAANQSGTAVIAVTVTDDGGTADGGTDTFQRSFQVTVNPVNDVPVVTQPIAPIRVEQGSVMTVVGVAPYFRDVDIATNGDVLECTVMMNSPVPDDPEYNPNLVTASIEDGGLRLICDTDQAGHVDVTVRATDLAGESASLVVRVTVTPPDPFNTPPVATPIPPVIVDEDAADVVLNLWDYFSDAEDADEDLVFDVALASGVPAGPVLPTIEGENGRTNHLRLSFLANASGEAQYTITARDTGGKTTAATLPITANPVNDPPRGPAVPVELTLQPASEETVVDLWQYFDDLEDRHDLHYEIVPDTLTDPALFVSSGGIDADGFLRLRLAADGGGASAVAIQAVDADGGTGSATFVFDAPTGASLPRPTVSVATTQDPGATGPGAGFVVRRTGDLNSSLDVSYTFTGSATYQTDYTSPWPVRGAIHFAAGEVAVNIAVYAAGDTPSAASDVVNLRLGGDASYALGEAAAAGLPRQSLAPASSSGTGQIPSGNPGIGGLGSAAGAFSPNRFAARDWR